MDRRASLALLLGKQRKTASKSTTLTATLTNTFSPYTGEWGMAQAAHLLRRATFGPTNTEIKQAAADGLANTVSMLFEELPLPDDPIYYNYQNDPLVAQGETWVNDIETPDIGGLRAGRRRSLQAWSFKNIYEEGINIREKMVLFWHNHFVVASTNDPRFAYTYMDLIRRNALGNFKTLVEEISIDPSMLVYLNGTQNSRFAPNENFSRELLELFTIGKGPAAGPGDYTNYTEDDVVELARALTGWKHFDPDPAPADIGKVQAWYNDNRHDKDDKQLSHRFNNIVITNGGDQEYKTVIDIIFQKDEVARFICRKLYRWFVGSEIGDDIEINIIDPMSQMLIADGYNVKPAIMALLSSEHFYEESLRGCMVSHPIDYLYKITNTLELEFPETILNQYKLHKIIFDAASALEMRVYDHPNVAGWKAFYQAPQFYKLWINAVSLPIRMSFAEELVEGFVIPSSGGEVAKINVLNFVASLDNPSNPNDLINEMATILFAYPITQEQLVALKDILIPGLPDFEWEVEYGDYASGNTELEEAIETKLKSLIGTMLKMPEFYLI